MKVWAYRGRALVVGDTFKENASLIGLHTYTKTKKTKKHHLRDHNAQRQQSTALLLPVMVVLTVERVIALQ